MTLAASKVKRLLSGISIRVLSPAAMQQTAKRNANGGPQHGARQSRHSRLLRRCRDEIGKDNRSDQGVERILQPQ